MNMINKSGRLLEHSTTKVWSTHITSICKHVMYLSSPLYIKHSSSLQLFLTLNHTNQSYLKSKWSMCNILGEIHFWTEIKGAQHWWNPSITITTCALKEFTPNQCLFNQFWPYPINVEPSKNYQDEVLLMFVMNAEKFPCRAWTAPTTLEKLSWKAYKCMHKTGISRMKGFSHMQEASS